MTNTGEISIIIWLYLWLTTILVVFRRISYWRCCLWRISKNTGKLKVLIISWLAYYLTTYYRNGVNNLKNERDFSHHAGMLSEVLHHPAHLMIYIVGKCYPKILYRLTNFLSEPYWNSLCNTEMCFPKFQDFTHGSPRATRKQLKYDKEFFGDILPQLKLGIDIPRLRQALLEPGVLDEPIRAYNEDTYVEYHHLLQELLKRFKKSLEMLNALKDLDLDKITEAVKRAVSLGISLQTMVGGYVIKVHLRVITMALLSQSEFRRDRPMHNIDEEMEWDEEIYQIGKTFPMWKAFSDWLKLMFVHFESVRILRHHMTKIRNSEVTIKVITTPRPDTAQCDWITLLNNKRYFEDATQTPFSLIGPSSASTKDIIHFLQGQLERAEAHQANVPAIVNLFRKFCTTSNDAAIPDSETDSNFDAIIEKMRSISLASADGSSDVLGGLIDTTLSLKDEGGRPADEHVDAIIKDLESLKDSATFEFFKTLRNLKFWGSQHGELTLACFMLADSSKLPKEYKHIADELSVIVSSPH